MTITYPRTMPAFDMLSCGFTIRRSMLRAESGGGVVQEMESFPARWEATWTTRPLNETQRGEMVAWLDSMRGAQKRFIGFDPTRCYPLAYGVGVLALSRAGGGAFDGTATLSSYTASTLTVATLPSGYQAKPGDMVSVTNAASKRSLHRVVEAATASGGGSITLTVEPTVTITLAASNVVNLVRAAAIMHLLEMTVPPRNAFRQSITFSARQVL